MSKVRVAINGFGRIGRLVLRGLKEYDTKGLMEVVALQRHNAAVDQMAYLLKYDSVHRRFDAQISYDDSHLIVDGHSMEVLRADTAEELPWKKLGVDLIIEASGAYTKSDKASWHLQAGAKKVLLTSPGKSDDIATFVMGVNEKTYDPASHHIVSNASCTTNCLAPVAKVLHEQFGIVSGLMTTEHSYTSDQRLHDKSHKNNFRARAAALSMVPTTTGAAKAVGKVIPELNGKLSGLSIRVPTPDVSLVDLTFVAAKPVTVESINQAMKEASESTLKGYLGYGTDDCVSVDFTHDPRSAVFAPSQTMVIGNLAKVLAWYDNEWGYSCRCIDLANYMIEKGF